MVNLSDAPESDAAARQNPRLQTVTDMDFTNGKLYVSGLSSEEWASALRAIPFPFQKADKGTNIQIWHASHGRFETTAPVRTFVPYTIAGQPYILAAYTCTPLVKIPLADLKPGAQIKPVTIADVGAGNQPLDMVPYKKDGHEFILISNSRRGVMKMNADNMGNYKAVNSPEQPNPPDYIFGMPYETVDKPEGRHATGAGGCGERDDPQQARGCAEPDHDCTALKCAPDSSSLPVLRSPSSWGRPQPGNIHVGSK